MTSECYGKDRLKSLYMDNVDSVYNAAAARYGYARFGLSTPDGNWTFGNNGIVNGRIPMPCSIEDSKDMAYVGKIFEFIDKNMDLFDITRIYTEGFSQNSMFSAYIGFCYPDRVTGIWQGGSGLAFKSDNDINLPQMEVKCSKSGFKEYGRNCSQIQPCTDCKYWPIYPCFHSQKPMIVCVSDYNNDYIASARSDPETQSTTLNMYNTAKAEGHDARMMRFKPSNDGSIPGTHTVLKNEPYWQSGCLGITPACTKECETSFTKCVKNLNPSSALKRTQSFTDCIKKDTFENLTGCDLSCSPTFDMLTQSEEPYKKEFAFGVFGENDKGPQPQGAYHLA